MWVGQERVLVCGSVGPGEEGIRVSLLGEALGLILVHDVELGRGKEKRVVGSDVGVAGQDNTVGEGRRDSGERVSELRAVRVANVDNLLGLSLE